MRLLLPCMKCQVDFGRPDFVMYSADVLNTRVARFTCRHGHKCLAVLQSHKFELLGELALNAILDSYTREAVSSFTAALERFQEFYIRVIGRSKKADEDEFEKTWKRVTRQSERQTGAYLFTHLFEEGSAPPLLDDKHVSFRNRVARELREETGVIAKNWSILWTTSPDATVRFRRHFLLARDLTVGAQDLGEGERIELHWIHPWQACRLALDGSIREEISALALLRFFSERLTIAGAS